MMYDTMYMCGVLVHHGIHGMQWGKRNGPPYPLSKEISTGNRLKIDANTQKGLKKTADDYKYKKVSKNRTIWRGGSENSNFMNRKYTYVNVCQDYYDHNINTSEGFDGLMQYDYEMRPTKDLKIATLDTVFDAILDKYGNKALEEIKINDIDKNSSKYKKAKMLSKNVVHKYKDGMFGNDKEFDKTVKYLKKLGFDGMEDPVDGARQRIDKEKVIATVIFDPGENLKIIKKIER